MARSRFASDFMTTGETLVFGHRGASAVAPQNTLAAFELAAQQGAHGIELDVHLTRDGQLVVIHDFTVESTTDGAGAVADMTLAQLQKLDAGGWFSSEFAGERIPTLDEVFSAVGDKLLINVEIKSSAAGIENAVVDCIRHHHMEARVLISSFDADVLRRLRPLTDVPLGYLFGFASQSQLAEMASFCAALHPWHEQVDAVFVQRARELDCLVNVWTVNDRPRACQLEALGVNSIITDQPAEILAALAAC